MPKINRKASKEIRALATAPSAAINTSEIPELKNWNNAVRGKFYKQPITVRLDPDVVAWLKSQGKGYQTRINALLRMFMEAARVKPPQTK